MRLAFFSIPALDPAAAQAELNAFLASHRVVSAERELVRDALTPFWALCVHYVDAAGPVRDAHKGEVDYREELPPEQFALFSKLRDLRKDIATEEGVQRFVVFTNLQLAEMVRRSCKSAAELGAIAGIGKARLEKYGERFLAVLRAHETAAATDSQSKRAESGVGA